MSKKREHLIDVALDLFCKEGFHATGIDRILSEAKVAKNTLYKHFRSKDELILAALRRSDETFRNDLMQNVEKKHKDPLQRVLGIFDFYYDWFNRGNFAGCMFTNVAAEYSNIQDPINKTAHEHKQLMLDYVQKNLDMAKVTDTDLAIQISVLLEGTITLAYVMGNKEVTCSAKKVAKLLLESYI